MATIDIELSEATAQAALAAGLLTPEALERLLTEALRRQEVAESLPNAAEQVFTAQIALPDSLAQEVDGAARFPAVPL